VRIEMLSIMPPRFRSRVGAFGTFNKREIELKPGKYTVVARVRDFATSVGMSRLPRGATGRPSA